MSGATLTFLASVTCASSAAAMVLWQARQATLPSTGTRKTVHVQAPVIRASVAPGSRLLVTGATGFTSGWIIQLALQAGYKVRLLLFLCTL